MPSTPRLETHLTGHEFWLLSQCVTSPFSLHHLLYEKVHQVTNSRDPKMGREDVITALRSMASKACIHVRSPVAKAPRRYRLVTDPERIVCCAEAEDLEYQRSGPGSRSLMQLTPKGARTWEEFARPDWSRFLDRRLDEHSVGTITCQDRRWLEQFVQVYCSWIGVHCKTAVRRIGRWRPTYWKSLPHGYRASLRRTADAPAPRCLGAGLAVNFMDKQWRTLASGW